jgi:hypothetical protein
MISFDIHAWSSHSASYHPKHIKDAKPTDQSSRWSSGSNNQLQFITLKLDKPCIVQFITFGKYHKVHVCNLKEFKVYGGMDPANMSELLHAGLRNDTENETFPLLHKANHLLFPCLYIKICPLLAWGANFNFSIWFVQLDGIADPALVQNALDNFTQFRENLIVRLALKHFRQRNLFDLFNQLSSQTRVLLEDPLLSNLFSLLNVGDFDQAEAQMSLAAENSLFAEYISDCMYKPFWKKINSSIAPSMRGGHQMCIDSDASVIWLFGGWNGHQDLSDFWCFDINSGNWSCISQDTRMYTPLIQRWPFAPLVPQDLP